MWVGFCCCFFFSSRRRHTRFDCDWSSDVCSSDLAGQRLCVRGFHAGHERFEVWSDDQVSEENDDASQKRSPAGQQDELLGIERREGVLSLVRNLTERGHGLSVARTACAKLPDTHLRFCFVLA